MVARIATVLALGVLAAPADAAQIGGLDPAFGISLVAHAPALTSVAADGGKVVASNDDGVYRFNADGSADTSFGDGGFVSVPTHGTVSTAKAPVIAVDAEHRIVRADTYTAAQHTSQDPTQALVERFLPDGRPDPGFGTDGRVLVQPSTGGLDQDDLRDVALLPDGSIMAVGTRTTDTPVCGRDIFLLRLAADGSAFPGFGTGGVVDLGVANFPGLASTPGPACGTVAESMSVGPDGKLTIAGVVERNIVGSVLVDGILFRVGQDGVVDDSFGSGGVVEFPSPNPGCPTDNSRVAVDGLGRAVVLRKYSPYPRCPTFQWAVVRFDRDGAQDAAFTPYLPTTTAVGDLIVQPDGLPLLAGALGDLPFVTRLGADGLADPTFGDGGTSVTNPAPGASSASGAAWALAWDPAGKVVVGGAEEHSDSPPGSLAYRLIAAIETPAITPPVTAPAPTQSVPSSGTPTRVAATAKPKPASTRLTAKRGVVTLVLRCPRTGACGGTAKLTTGKHKVASARYKLKPGAKQRLKLKLSRTFRRKLTKARKHTLKVTLTLKPTAGRATTSRLTIKR